MNENRNLALVLSSGGARGIAHLGAIMELESKGYNITSLSGSSIGALIGGIYASGKMNEFIEWVITLKKFDVFNLVDFTLSTNGLIKAEKIFKKLEKIIPDMAIEDMKVPLTIVSTDILNEKEVIYSTGSFYEAVRASIAIPTIITTVRFQGAILVDGGVLNPLPISQVKRTTGDLLAVVNLNCNDPSLNMKVEEGGTELLQEDDSISKIDALLNSRKRGGGSYPKIISDKGYISILRSSTSLMLRRISELQVQLHRPDLLISIPASSAGTFDFHKSIEMIELGRTATSAALSKFNSKG